MSHSKKPESDALARYLEGEVTRSEAEAIEKRLEQSEDARRELAQLRQIVDTLGAPEEDLEDFDMVAFVNDAIDETGQQPPRELNRGRSWAILSTVGLAAAATIALFLFGPWFAGSTEDDSQFRSKGESGKAVDRERWIGIDLFRAMDNAPAVPVKDVIAADDELLIAYRNIGPKPYRYLMVFAVDSSGSVYWYYPAYLDKNNNPAAIPIKKDANVELREKVRHPLAKGTLAIYGLFCDKVIYVSQVEQLLSLSGTNFGARLDIPETAQHIVKLRVK